MSTSRKVEVANVTRGTVLGSEVQIADTALTRLVGLLAHSELSPGSGLLIEPSSGVHTFGMRFAIDVVALDRKLRVLGLWENLGPLRFAAISFKTCKVLELPVGAIRESGTQINDQLMVLAPGTMLGLREIKATQPNREYFELSNRTLASFKGEQL